MADRERVFVYKDGQYTGEVFRGTFEQWAAYSAAHGYEAGLEPSLTDAEIATRDKRNRGTTIRDEASRRMNALVSKYPLSERETWSIQEQDALALQADPDAPAPFLRALVATSGDDLMTLATIVLTKAALLRSVTAHVLGKQRALITLDIIPEDYTADRHWV